MRIAEVPTPALIVDGAALTHNLDTMAAALPGDRLRAHVKAFKCTRLAREIAARGSRRFCAATVAEIEGMAAAGLGDDLLLANEVVEPSKLRRLAAVAAAGARVTVAVDSDETVDAAAAAGLSEVLIDVNVGLPRCGCDPADAGRLADRARAAGLTVRGVMGYEGHVVGLEDPEERRRGTGAAMERLAAAHAAVGGDVISAGGTGTFDCNRLATEIQAGSFTLMDTAYARLGLPFRQAFWIEATVISVADGWAVADAGLKAHAADHGDPGMDDGHRVWFLSDEHTTFGTGRPVRVGDRVRLWPAHVDPTVAKHDRLHIAEGDRIVDVWPIDLRGW